MQFKYKCCFCGKFYDWYEEVCANKEDENKCICEGTIIHANSIVLKNFLPLPEKDGEKIEVIETNGNLEKMVINLCRDCMRELLTKCYPSDSGKNNCFNCV